MIYVTSDIHGNFEKYMQIFDKIDLKDDDTLFILGDIVDRGDDSIKILLDMMYRFNVIPLLGNHEYMAINVLSKLSQEITDENLTGFDDDFMTGMLTWFENGGAPTLEQFKKQSLDDRQAILDYFDEFSLYEEIEVNGQEYVLVHAGLDNFSPKKELDEYNLHELVWCETDYDRVYFEDKILITGHTPVAAILFDKTADKILKQNNHIAIDCGCGHGGKLAVLCLDTMEEFYF
ncbi:MAG: metallophosphoesterase [Clostridia bacterium]